MYKEPSKEIDMLAASVVDAALEVHKALGPGYLESVYEEALCVELSSRGIPFERQKILQVSYKDHPVGQGKLDVLAGGKLIIELKAVEDLAPIHTAQIISYLKAANLPLGLLINFNTALLKNGIKRVVLSS
jgi:GxxExxY protein